MITLAYLFVLHMYKIIRYQDTIRHAGLLNELNFPPLLASDLKAQLIQITNNGRYMGCNIV